MLPGTPLFCAAAPAGRSTHTTAIIAIQFFTPAPHNQQLLPTVAALVTGSQITAVIRSLRIRRAGIGHAQLMPRAGAHLQCDGRPPAKRVKTLNFSLARMNREKASRLASQFGA